MERREDTVLPSGVVIMKRFDEHGVLIDEMFALQKPVIILQRRYEGSRVVEESYIVGRSLARRERYEKERLACPDLPAADANLPDANAELLRLAREEKRRGRRAARQAAADPDAARLQDEECRKLLADMTNLSELSGYGILLGERTLPTSKRILARLIDAGAISIHLGKLDREESARVIGAGTMVVELGEDAAERKRILAVMRRLGSEIGYPTDGPEDSGARYAFAMLD